MIYKNIQNQCLTTIPAAKLEIGETIETKMNRIIRNKEAIKDSAPLMYQERKNGIDPGCDIRTDRWDIAIEGMNKVAKTKVALRIDRAKTEEKKPEGQSTQGTEPNNPPAA